MSSLYNLNKDLAHIQYLQRQLNDLRIQFVTSFEHMKDGNINTWLKFKQNLLSYQRDWRNSDIKRVPYIKESKRLRVDEYRRFENKMCFELEYFDATVINTDGKISFEVPFIYHQGLNLYLEMLQDEFDNETINVKFKDSVESVSKVYVLFIIGIDELDRYTSSIHFEWLFDEFKCTVPVTYLYDRSLLLLERIVQI